MLRVTCTQCHVPFILNREALQAALDEVQNEGFKHYNAYCSNCGRQTKVSKKQLRQAAPWWKPGAKVSKTQAAPIKKETAAAKSTPKAKAPLVAKTKTPAKAKSKAKPPAKAKTAKKTPPKKKK